MPDMNIFCKQCGSDRFNVTTSTPVAETVHSIFCSVCGQAIKVNEVVTFRDVLYLSRTPEDESAQFFLKPPK